MEYLYADGRGVETDFGPVVTSGALIVKKPAAGKLEVIPVPRSARVSLRAAELGLRARQVTVTALDAAGAETGSRRVKVADDVLTLEFDEQTFSMAVQGR